MDERTDYKDFVNNYFVDIKVKMPPDMQIGFSPDLDIDQFFLLEFEDGGHPSGIMLSTLYFTGNKRIGVIIMTNILRGYMKEQTGKVVEKNGRKYMLLQKSTGFDWASLITYFKKAISR